MTDQTGVFCPRCGARAQAADAHPETDWAWCARCQEAFAPSECGKAKQSGGPEPVAEVDLHQPPRGAWFEKTFDGFVVGATTRSGIAFFLVPFTCVWSGGSLGGIYGSQIAQGKFNLMLCLFGVPFLVGTLFLGGLTLMAVFGKVVVSVNAAGGTVFVGIGPFGRRRTFDPRSVRRVYAERGGKEEGRNVIVLEGRERIAFGSGLNEGRRYFMLQVLRTVLVCGSAQEGAGGD